MPPPTRTSQFRWLVGLLLVLSWSGLPVHVRGADPLIDTATMALAELTDPARLETLSDETFRAQLGPALGWLHAARRRDVAPEAMIARAFARNGVAGERALLTREALLRNLARADAWELLTHEASARALSVGKPAPIPVGMHQGHFARASVVRPEGLGREARREFACLVLRADDELPPAPAKPYPRLPGDRLAQRPARPRAPRPAAVPILPVSYDEPLPVE